MVFLNGRGSCESAVLTIDNLMLPSVLTPAANYSCMVLRGTTQPHLIGIVAGSI